MQRHLGRWRFSCPQVLLSRRVGGCFRGGALKLQQVWGSPGGLVDHRWLGPVPELLIQQVGEGQELALPIRSQVTPMLLVQGPDSEPL